MSLHMQIIKARKAGHFGGPGISRFQGQMMYSRGRAGQAGGIFGDIGKFLAKTAGSLVKGVPIIGGLISAPLEAIGAGALDKKKKGVAGSSLPASVASFAPSGPGMGGMPTLSMPNIAPGYAPEQTYPTSTASGPTMTNGKGSCAPSGYHWNKSGYWSNESGMLPGASWTPAGTKLVKNRHRNPYNPKAASRAMSRLASLSQGMKSLERQLTKLAPKRRSSCAGKCATKRK